MTTPAVAPLGDFTAIPIASSVPQMVWAGVQGSSVLLANQDLTNAVTIARRPSFAVGAGNTANVPALGSLTVDGSKSIWGLAPAGTANLLVLPGGSQWAPSPAQVAAQISALGLATLAQQINQNTAIPGNISTTGVPLLNKSTVLANQAAVGIAANGNTPTGSFTITQPSFELLISVSFSVAVGATPYAFIVIQWSDSTSGLVTDKDTFVVNVASNAALNSLPFNIKGPSKGDTLKLTIYNLDAARSMVATYTLLENSRVIPSEVISLGADWKENSANISLAISATRVQPDSKVIATFVNSTLGVGATDVYTTPPATGLATLNFQEIGVASANVTVVVQPIPTAIYGTVYLVNDILVAGNPNKLFYNDLIMPNGPLQVTVHNGGSVNANYSGVLIAQY